MSTRILLAVDDSDYSRGDGERRHAHPAGINHVRALP